MSKWIRWGGLVAFVVIVAAFMAFFILLAGPLTKNAIESYGTEANGALVEVDSVGVSFYPIGLNIRGLQVTDAEKPMRNAMQFDRAVLELELAPLWLGKFIIREMSVDGLRFGTVRSKSGAVEIKKEDITESESSFMDNVDLPSADEILARETFTTDAAGDAFRKAYEQNKIIIDERLAAVPSDAALKVYEDEIKAITSGRLESVDDFKARKQKLDALKKRFEADQEAIVAARKAINVAQNEVGSRLKELKDAPGNDLKNLISKYQLNADGATNLTSLLFGSEAGEWAKQTLYWYEKVKPYLEKDDADVAKEKEIEMPRGGRFVNFPTNDPWPSALLREAHLTAHLTGGDLLIEVRDVTSSQSELGRPTSVVANGSNLKSVDDLTIEMILDHRSRPGKDSISLTVKDWTPAAMGLGLAGAQLQSANIQANAYAVVSGGTLHAEGNADFLSTKFITASKTVFEKELGNALAAVKNFNVGIKAHGKLKSPSVSISSNLDKQLSKSFERRLKERQSELESRLEKELQNKLQAQLGSYGDQYAQLAKLDGSLNDKLKEVRSLASTQIEDLSAQEKREAKEKLNREKAEAEAKAKEKLKKMF